MGWLDSTHGRMRYAYRSLDRRPGRTIPLLRAIYSYKNTIKTDFEEIIW
jgi:hypothetical protein